MQIDFTHSPGFIHAGIWTHIPRASCETKESCLLSCRSENDLGLKGGFKGIESYTQDNDEHGVQLDTG